MLFPISYVAVLVVLCSTPLHAQIPSLGFCPEYLPMADFNMNKFLGRWFESERYFTISDATSRCPETLFDKGSYGKISVTNAITARVTSVTRLVKGDIQDIGKDGEGRITVRYQAFPIPYEVNYYVLDTDYRNYAVLWACSGFGPLHSQNAWIMTRDRLPSGTVLQKAYGVLDKYKINRAFFVKVDQSGCNDTFKEDEVDENGEPLPENEAAMKMAVEDSVNVNSEQESPYPVVLNYLSKSASSLQQGEKPEKPAEEKKPLSENSKLDKNDQKSDNIES